MNKRNLKLSRTILAALSATAAALSAQTVPSDASDTPEEPPTVNLPALDVIGEREAHSYSAAFASSSSKLAIPLLETAQNIQVVPRAMIDDQGAFQLEDIIKNVAGVNPGGYYDNWDYFRIRGFVADFNTFVDGLRGGNGLGEETFGLERVEIVKGPASSLFGRGPASGLVNVVSKRPQRGRFGELKFSAGSYGFYETTLDYNAPLDADGRIVGRLSAVHRTRDSFVDQAGTERLFLAPALTWRVGPETSFTFLGKHSGADIIHAMPLPAIGTIFSNTNGQVPHSRFVGEPGSNEASETSTQGGYEFVHRFNPALTVRQNLRYDYYNQEWFSMLYPGYLDADERTLYRYPYDYFQNWHDFAVDTRIEAAFRTGEVEHQLVAGVDVFRKTYHASYATIDFSDPTGAGYIPLDLFTPVYGTPIPDMPSIGAFDEKTNTTGLYLDDHLRFDNGVTLTFGGRYEFARLDSARFEEFVPRAGATWQFRPGMTAYGSFSKSFNTQFGTVFSETADAGDPVGPETGTNFEVGLKTAAADGRLTATVSLYQLTRQNLATSDLAHPGFVLITGEQRSRGVEFDGRFQPVAGLELSAAYAYTSAKITEDNSLPVGARTTGVPRHSFSTWARYTVQAGAWKGFGLGLGGRYYTAQAADNTYAAPFELPAYALVDAALYYETENYRVQVNVENLLDREYYEGAYDRLYVLPGEPLTVRGTVGWKF